MRHRGSPASPRDARSSLSTTKHSSNASGPLALPATQFPNAEPPLLPLLCNAQGSAQSHMSQPPSPQSPPLSLRLMPSAAPLPEAPPFLHPLPSHIVAKRGCRQSGRCTLYTMVGFTRKTVFLDFLRSSTMGSSSPSCDHQAPDQRLSWRNFSLLRRQNGSGLGGKCVNSQGWLGQTRDALLCRAGWQRLNGRHGRCGVQGHRHVVTQPLLPWAHLYPQEKIKLLLPVSANNDDPSIPGIKETLRRSFFEKSVENISLLSMYLTPELQGEQQ